MEVPAPASHPCLFIYHVKVAAIFKITAGYYMIKRYTERNRREGLRLLLLPKKYTFPDGEEYELVTPHYEIKEWYADSIPMSDLRISVRQPLRHVGMGADDGARLGYAKADRR